MKFLNFTTIKIKATYTINNIKDSIRFNTYCEKYIEVIPSRKGVKKAIKKGELQLNGKLTTGGVWLKNGDIITFVDLELTPPKTYHLKLNVIYEDDFLAVINKPAGINVSGNKFKTIQNALLYNLKPSKKKDALNWPLPVHRLDNQTSGLLLISKTKTARIKLGQYFEQKNKIHKIYQAVVIGKMPKFGEISYDIATKKAKTTFKCIKNVASLKNKYLSLIELQPKTGRTHQLRIHCSNLGYPILGDKLYGKAGLILKNKGLFLCATELKFEHPITKKMLDFKINTPQKFLKRLENEKRRFDNYN